MIELDTIDYNRPVKLTNNIYRLTSKNPSQMTGPGTNTYIIGRSSFIVIDPGPALESHIQNILLCNYVAIPLMPDINHKIYLITIIPIQ